MKAETVTLSSLTRPDPQRVASMHAEMAETASKHGLSKDIETAIKIRYFPDPSTRP